MTHEASARVVRVRVALPDRANIPRGAVLRVRVDDITAADRASTVLMSRAVAVPKDITGNLVVDLPIPDGMEPAASYGVFAHLDASGSGQVDAGDYISPKAHPVLTHGAPSVVDVSLVRVGPPS